MQSYHQLLRPALLTLMALLGTILVLPTQERGDLYIVTGLATPKYAFTVPSAIFVIHEEKDAVVRVANLVDGEAGTAFIQADHDRRIVVMGSPSLQPTQLVILGMDEPRKPVKVPVRFTAEFLCGRPNEMLVQACITGGVGPDAHLWGIDLNRDGSKSLPRILDWAESRYVRTEGFWSPGDLHTYLELFPKDGKLLLKPDINTSELGIELPPGMEPGAGERLLLVASNDDMFVIGRYKRSHEQDPIDKPGVHRLSIYDKRKGAWQNASIPSAGASVRVLGQWVVSARAAKKNVLRGTGDMNLDKTTERKSPGSGQRKNPLNPNERERDRVSIDWLFDYVPFFFPGELLLYDIRSQKGYSILTGQGDSEVLLVEGNTVYYRVNDELYRGTIGKTAVENRVKIVSDDKLQLAHWAFWGPVFEK